MLDQTTRVALYARVSSERQANEWTIDSQVAALRQRIATDGYQVEPELCFRDEGFSGATLLRPALERLRDLAHSGAVDRLHVLAPDRLARKYVYQIVLTDEFRHHGVAVVFLNEVAGAAPAEADLLLQMQGMIAEYERAKILERTRRGRRFAARQGKVSALGHAPYGYRYVAKNTKPAARRATRWCPRKVNACRRSSAGSVWKACRWRRCRVGCVNKACRRPKVRPAGIGQPCAACS